MPLDFHDALSLSGLSEARFRFLEKEFGDCLGIETHFFLPARYSSKQVSLMLKLEEIMQSTGRSPDEVRETVQGYLDTRRKGIWVTAVTSGKGGVGKTSMAVNLAVSLSRLGLRPAVVDADLGTANAHLLLGLLPERSLGDLVGGSCTLEDIITERTYGVRLVPGGSGSRELADLDGPGRERLSAEIGKLALYTDTIIIDTGSGISENVMRFLSLADDIIVVITPNVASCVDALALLKAAGERRCQGSLKVLVNRCRSESEAKRTFGRFLRAARRLGGTPPAYIGYAPEDHRMEEAYFRGLPVTSHSSACAASRAIRRIAKTALSSRGERRAASGSGVLKLFEELAVAS